MSFEYLSREIQQNVLLGLSESQLTDFADVKIERSLLPALKQFQTDVQRAGFKLGVVSAFRSFERQLFIWNRKALGQRPILDSCGAPLCRADLSDEDALFAILRWSALPGTSRHHWGTDFDVVDLSAMSADYQIQLTVEETCEAGIFAPFHHWLNDYLNRSPLGFFKPYAVDTGGVACEPWHLSFAPAARQYQMAMNKQCIIAQLEHSDIQLKRAIFRHLDEIYERFVWVDWSLYPQI